MFEQNNVIYIHTKIILLLPTYYLFLEKYQNITGLTVSEKCADLIYNF